MKALRKDFWMEIRKSKARFISIFLIVALGVAFFSGIQAASPDMRFSGDAYYDQAGLMDLKVVGTLGLTQEDVEALKDVEGVKAAEGAYSEDVMCGEEEDRKVLHVESLNREMNHITPSEGRLPQKEGEIFLDHIYAGFMGYEIGDRIRVEQQEGGLLERETYTVCGVGTSPLYISFNRGNTNLGSGEISGFAYVLPEEFDSEVFTQIYLRFHGSEDLTSYTDAYDNLIEKLQGRVEGIEKERCQVRYETIREEAQMELSDGEKELEKGRKEAEKKLGDAEKELADGEAELADGKEKLADGEKKLGDARTELVAARADLKEGKEELALGRQQLEEGKQKLADGEAELVDARAQAAEGQLLLNQGKEKLDAGWEEFHKNEQAAEEGKKQLEAAKKQLEEGRERLKSGKKQLEEKKKELQDKKAEVETGKAQIPAAREQLLTQQKACEEGMAQVEAAELLLAEKESELAPLKEQILVLEGQRDSLAASQLELEGQITQLQLRYEELEAEGASQEELLAVKAEMEALVQQKELLVTQKGELLAQLAPLQEMKEQAEAEITSGKETLGIKRKELEQGLAEIKMGLARLDETESELSQAELQIAAGEKEIQAGFEKLEEEEKKLPAAEAEIKKNEAILKEGQEKLKAAEAELAKAQEELDKQESSLSSAWAQITAGEAELSKGRREIEENQQKLAEGEEKIRDGEQKLADGEKEIKKQEKKLADARKEIEDGEKELTDGRKEYEDAKKEAEEEIEEGEKKLEDARAEIEKLEVPEWILSDRNALPEYSDYGDNADRIRNIGQVFPVIFFLVAALISLTTMTRMVEDQRTQIGTLKALGYSKTSIMAKYVSYALLATVGGSICGVLVGEKILPYIIIKSYGIMYHNMASNMQIHYEWKFALIASAAAVVCTLGATLFSCCKELAETPASLMRPPAPKEGKRVLLERAGFLWKHLSFSWKSTLRNLFRYKKRLFMTIFGIAGSMALLLVGYGIQDSIMDIAVRQYEELQHYDGTIISDEDAGTEEKEKLHRFLRENEEILRYTDVQFSKMETPAGKSNLSVYVYVPKNLDNFREDVTLQNRRTKEKYTLSENGAAISEKTAKLAGLEVGDELILLRDHEPYPVRVDIITENYMGHYIYMAPEVYEKVFGEAPVFENTIFTVKDKEQLEQVGNEILEYPAALSISYTSSLAEQLERMLSTLENVIIVLIVSAGMLAFVVLYNLNNINITERQRELATLKVLGFYDREVSQYVFRENILLTIIGVAAGAAFGFFLHRYVITTVEVDAVMFGRNIRPISYLVSAIFTCGFSAFVNMVMHFKLKKIDMVESLKSVE